MYIQNLQQHRFLIKLGGDILFVVMNTVWMHVMYNSRYLIFRLIIKDVGESGAVVFCVATQNLRGMTEYNNVRCNV